MATDDKEPIPDPQDEEYDSNEDEDFNPDATNAADEDVSASSDSDEEGDDTAKPKKAKRKSTKRKQPEPTDAELDSGDEATIKERKRKRRKGKEQDEESGGEGGLIKTRAQRLVEKQERKERKRADRGEVTIDVDDVWARLHAVPVGRQDDLDAPSQANGEQANGDTEKAAGEVIEPSDQLIRIKRRIAFAGEVTEVEEEVLKSSAAAQAYLAEHPEADPSNAKSRAAATGQQAAAEGDLQRPLRRPSIFEPNPTATVRGVNADKLRPRAPGRLDVLMAERRLAEEKKKKAERMSTVQKSAVDWKGFVADQGIGEELDIYGKSKGGFMAREQFLDRVAGANEAARRAARLKG